MTHSTSRRSLLQGVAFATLPLQAGAAQDTSVIAATDSEYRNLVATSWSDDGLTVPAWINDLEDTILTAPITCAEDAALKLTLATELAREAVVKEHIDEAFAQVVRWLRGTRG